MAGWPTSGRTTKRADVRFAGGNCFGAQFDHGTRFNFAGVDAPDEIEHGKHH